MVNQHRVGLGAFAVIRDGSGRVLVCHRRDVDVWDLPGGGVEPGELPWVAAVREVAEETGLVVEVEQLTGVYAKPAELVLVFACAVTGGELQPTTEADQHTWLRPDELPTNMNPNQVHRVRDAVACSGQPALRDQPGYSSARPSEWCGARI